MVNRIEELFKDVDVLAVSAKGVPLSLTTLKYILEATPKFISYEAVAGVMTQNAIEAFTSGSEATSGASQKEIVDKIIAFLKNSPAPVLVHYSNVHGEFVKRIVDEVNELVSKLTGMKKDISTVDDFNEIAAPMFNVNAASITNHMDSIIASESPVPITISLNVDDKFTDKTEILVLSAQEQARRMEILTNEFPFIDITKFPFNLISGYVVSLPIPGGFEEDNMLSRINTSYYSAIVFGFIALVASTRLSKVFEKDFQDIARNFC